MQTQLAEEVFERVKTLPIELQREALRFVGDLQAKASQNTSDKESNLQKLWREIDEIVADVPKEAWEEVPTDASINVDHYLYGAPKRQK